MELSATKDYGAIVNLLESIEEKIETETKNFQEEFTQKYNLDITREILQYASDFVKMKISLIIKDSIKEFNWFNIIIDCTEINLNMNEIEPLISRVQYQMKDSIPENAEDIQIILKKYLRKVICRIPTRWTEPVVLDFLKQFEDTLNQLGIIVD